MRITGIVLVLLFLLSSCNSQKRYLDKTLDLMEEHSIYSSQVDWGKIRKDSYKQLVYAEDNGDVNGIIKESLRYLKDGGHSFLMTSNRYRSITNGEESLPIIESEILEEQVGYLKVPGFIGSPEMAKKFAEKLQDLIKLLDQSNLIGWIIDLRENTGGNMWPVLLGLSPLLGEGVYGYFQDNKENRLPWSHENSQMFIGTNAVMNLEVQYKSKNSDKKIALLVGKKTASSGEATLISFIGKKNTKLFGFETAGLSTGNQSFKLKDGAVLYLTTTIFVDRNKVSYGKKVKPDYATFQPKEKAMEWIFDK